MPRLAAARAAALIVVDFCGRTRTTGRRWLTRACTRRSGSATATAGRRRSSSVASENNGLMFTNDVMPVKVRWFYTVAPMNSHSLGEEQRGRVRLIQG